MKRIFSLLGACLLVGLVAPGLLLAVPQGGVRNDAASGGAAISAAPGGLPAGQAAPAKQPQWKSRAEYDAFQEIVKTGAAQQKISLADAFLAKYPASDFKAQAELLKVQAYAQMKEVSQATAAAQQALKDSPIDPVKIAALHYLAFVFPYTYNSKAPDAAAAAATAESQAKEGLQLLQQVKKPTGASEAAFEAQVKQYRTDFNRSAGFAALQQKDYANAVTYLKAAIQDNPQDTHSLSLLGQAYLYMKPPDKASALWYLARGAAIAQQQNTPNAAALQKFFSQVYVSAHGSDAGEKTLMAQAAASATPPAGFAVAPPPKHQKTGNTNVDAFYEIQDALAVGGDQAQQAWSGLKGQPLGIIAFVESVAPGTVPGTYVVRADVMPQDRGVAGDYNLELQTNQSDAQYLMLGDPIHFQGTISAYTQTPKFMLTLSGVQIDNASLQMASERAKAAAQKANEKKSKRPAR
ncbi:MAG: tetratricopeptide repeat protein [Terriglobia bacterium]